MTEPDEATDGSADMPLKPVDEDLFRLLLTLEVEKAKRLQYCVSVVCLTPGSEGDPVDLELTGRAAKILKQALRATDVVSAASQGQVRLLLVDAETQDLPQIFRRSAAELSAHTVTGTPPGLRIPWSGGGGCYPLTATNGDHLLSQASHLTALARAEGRETLRLPN